MSRNTYTEINLNNLKKNILYLKSGLNPSTKFMAIVKANAYGHGLLDVSRYIESENLADYLGVAISDEAVKLRENGIHLPILILGLSNYESIQDIIQYDDIIPSVTTINELKEIKEITDSCKRKLKVHMKIDTGMNRIGFKDIESFEEALVYIQNNQNIILDGVFTHFAVSDDLNSSFTEEQYKIFLQYTELLKKHGLDPVIHCANSGAILNYPEMQCNMVRGGISMYGYNPSPLYRNDSLNPVLTWKTSIVHIKKVNAGETISYGRTYKADKDITVATLPVGYGDGFSRKLSNKGYVLIQGHRCNVLGTVCMDQIMCDVTEINPKIGEEVCLIGKQGNEEVSADLMAEWAETISYEVLLDISERVPRFFIS